MGLYSYFSEIFFLLLHVFVKFMWFDHPEISFSSVLVQGIDHPDRMIEDFVYHAGFARTFLGLLGLQDFVLMLYELQVPL